MIESSGECNNSCAGTLGRLDLYMPPNCDDDSPKPVVIFVTGGAWIIGYKGWAALLGQQLAEHHIIVTCLDYRNFPQGSVSDMVADISTGIGYVCQNITNLGGDPNRWGHKRIPFSQV
jgi:prenylcysteine alpha-carboxyl methylesterase